jgi:hypothetical protein
MLSHLLPEAGTVSTAAAPRPPAGCTRPPAPTAHFGDPAVACDPPSSCCCNVSPSSSLSPAAPSLPAVATALAVNRPDGNGLVAAANSLTHGACMPGTTCLMRATSHTRSCCCVGSCGALCISSPYAPCCHCCCCHWHLLAAAAAPGLLLCSLAAAATTAALLPGFSSPAKPGQMPPLPLLLPLLLLPLLLPTLPALPTAERPAALPCACAPARRPLEKPPVVPSEAPLALPKLGSMPCMPTGTCHTQQTSNKQATHKLALQQCLHMESDQLCALLQAHDEFLPSNNPPHMSKVMLAISIPWQFDPKKALCTWPHSRTQGDHLPAQQPAAAAASPAAQQQPQPAAPARAAQSAASHPQTAPAACRATRPLLWRHGSAPRLRPVLLGGWVLLRWLPQGPAGCSRRNTQHACQQLCRLTRRCCTPCSQCHMMAVGLGRYVLVTQAELAANRNPIGPGYKQQPTAKARRASQCTSPTPTTNTPAPTQPTPLTSSGS